MTSAVVAVSPVGSLDAAFQAPLDYRFALDAAMSLLAGAGGVQVICRQPALVRDVAQRIEAGSADGIVRVALWVEPLQSGWQADMQALAQSLAPGGLLIIIASRPLAGWLPERRGWGGDACGMHVGGLSRLQNALRQAGYVFQAQYGVHTWQAMSLHSLGQALGWFGLPHLADRLACAARQKYCTDGWSSSLSTVALITAVRSPQDQGMWQ